MEATTLQEEEEPAPPRDLRTELFQDLSTQFATALSANTALPIAAQKALVELLDSEAPTAAEIIAAASKNDPLEEEASDE